MSLGDYMGAQCHACIGGTSVRLVFASKDTILVLGLIISTTREDMRKLDVGQHIVVGTPGRVFDMISRKVLRPNDIKQFVLDEADEMLSRGFKDQIYDVFRHLNQEIQVLLILSTTDWCGGFIINDVTRLRSALLIYTNMESVLVNPNIISLNR